MKIAVTGATGHVGANLVRTLVDDGHRVRALVHDGNRRGLDGVGCEFVDGELADAASLARAFAGCERVFHLAARISIVPGDDAVVRAVNVDGTRNVVAACEETRVARLIHFSSIHALCPEPHDLAIDETRALTSSPRMPPYDRSKAQAERIVLDAIDRGVDAVIVNPTAILGPHDYGPSAMGRVLLDLYHRKLPALVDGGFDWVDVRDIVAGALAAADRAPRGARYLLSGARKTVRELAALVEEITGVRAPRLVSPMWLARVGAPFATAVARIAGKQPLYTRHSLHALRNHQLVSHDKATRELGYTTRPLVETLTAAYDWFRQAGALA
ncbi:MAG TPA: SDR family oxidoreductase [Polyangia bacterium]|jgi:dihydroflavonol-4-reductase|nr:SDR family oxidoreductase [Polyangia bacterium]